jgi:hypothetical protein
LLRKKLLLGNPKKCTQDDLLHVPALGTNLAESFNEDYGLKKGSFANDDDDDFVGRTLKCVEKINVCLCYSSISSI